jgi:hypothetical protein
MVLALLIPGVAESATYFVAPDGSGDVPTIQDAVNSALDGDVIELGDGVFVDSGNRDIDYLSLQITIRSRSGDPERCIIDCRADSTNPHFGVGFFRREGPNSRLEGVTIRNGYARGPS